MRYDTLLIEIDDGVATLCLNRPTTRNAFNAELVRDIRAALAALSADGAVRALIITGRGAGFCAGADLAQQADTDRLTRAQAGADFQRDWINTVVTDLHALPFPVIAAVNGGAAGAGASLALACDVVLAARSAFFLFPFMPKLGIVPDMGATWFLPRLLGSARAMGASLIGDRIGAEQAERWGLIWQCVDDAVLIDEARALARRLAQAPAHAAPELRRAYARADAQGLHAQLAYELERQRELLAKPEFDEGVRAFVEKRDPRFPPRAP